MPCSVGMRIQYYVTLLKCSWVLSTGTHELETKLLLPEQKENEGKFPDEIAPSGTPMKSSETKLEKEFAEMEAAILTSQGLCSKISNHMGWIKEEKAFLCWGTKVRDTAPINELTRLQNQLARMKVLLASIKSGKNS